MPTTAKKQVQHKKSPSTQAGEFIREEIEHIRKGEHGARSAKQAIAIGLSKARRAGIPVNPPTTSEKRVKSAQSAYRKGQNSKSVSRTRSAASKKALEKESSSSVSRSALSQHARSVARKKGPAERSKIAKKAAKTRKKNS